LSTYVSRRSFELTVASALIAFGIFAAGSCVGVFAHDPGAGRAARPLTAASPGWMFFFVVNAYGLLWIMSGLATFGISALSLLYVAGFQFGQGYARAMERQLSLFQTAALVVPHSILELPAIIVAGVVGLSGVRVLMLYVLDGTVEFRQETRLLAALVGTALVLVLAAAMVEAYVTPWLISRFILR
jgi:stage II sporulation protein M